MCRGYLGQISFFAIFVIASSQAMAAHQLSSPVLCHELLAELFAVEVPSFRSNLETDATHSLDGLTSPDAPIVRQFITSSGSQSAESRFTLLQEDLTFAVARSGSPSSEFGINVFVVRGKKVISEFLSLLDKGQDEMTTWHEEEGRRAVQAKADLDKVLTVDVKARSADALLDEFSRSLEAFTSSVKPQQERKRLIEESVERFTNFFHKRARIPGRLSMESLMQSERLCYALVILGIFTCPFLPSLGYLIPVAVPMSGAILNTFIFSPRLSRKIQETRGVAQGIGTLAHSAVSLWTSLVRERNWVLFGSFRSAYQKGYGEVLWLGLDKFSPDKDERVWHELFDLFLIGNELIVIHRERPVD